MRTTTFKQMVEEAGAGYQEAKDEEFDVQFRKFMEQYMTHGGMHTIIIHDDIQGFMDSFSFPDEFEWASKKVQQDIETRDDILYMQMKDER